MNKYRSHNCSQLTEADSGKKYIYQDGYTEKEIMVIYSLLI